jgi:nucleotide-binding universal stress UspA family protein
MTATYLAGYDGSPASHAAVEARVEAVNVYSFATATYWVGVIGMQYDELENDLRRQAEDLVEGLDVHGVARVVVQADSPARGLHEHAAVTGAELIAVGTTHRGPFGRLAPGSVGMHLLHGAPCPVLVVPAECGDGPIETIGVAYDGREESRPALERADALAQQLGARLVVLGATQPLMVSVAVAGAMVPVTAMEDAERAFRSTLEEAAERTHAGAEAKVMIGAAAPSIAEATSGIDLLVTGSRGYGAVSGVVLGSVSRHLVDHAHCPVLVMPRPAAGA